MGFAPANLFRCLVSIEAGHLAIHENGAELSAVERFKRLFSPADGLGEIPKTVHCSHGHDLIHGIVVNDQYAVAGGCFSCRLPGRIQREKEPERGTEAGLALAVDCAAHQGCQPMRDCEPQADSSITAGVRRIGLREGPKDLLRDPWIDADSSVDDAEK